MSHDSAENRISAKGKRKENSEKWKSHLACIFHTTFVDVDTKQTKRAGIRKSVDLSAPLCSSGMRSRGRGIRCQDTSQGMIDGAPCNFEQQDFSILPPQ